MSILKFLSIWIILISSPYFVFTQAGILDTGFGTEGIVITDVPGGNDVSSRILLRDDGKIILAGRCDEGPLPDIFFVQYDTLGILDNEFGIDGMAISSLPYYTTFADATLQSDGKLLAIGNSIISPGEFDYALIRFLSDGNIDTDFGLDGVVYIDIGDTTNLGEAVIQLPDENIIVIGHMGGGDITSFTFSRFLPDGTIDLDFGTDGHVITPVDAESAIITRAHRRDDGKVYVVGYGIADVDFSDSFIAAFNEDGSLFTEFGTDGITWVDISTNSFFSFDLAIQPDDKILFIGTYTDDLSGDTNMRIVRLNSDGSIDESFADLGFFTVDFEGNDESGSALHLQPDNKILVAGHSNLAGNRNFVIMRLETNGDIDNLFGTDGITTTDFAAGDDKALDIIMQPDEKIIAAGQVDNLGLRIGMARYANDPDIGTEIQILNNSGLSLFPNPTTTVLKVYLQNSDIKNAHVLIYNIHGSQVSISPITSYTDYILISLPDDLARGLYFLSIETDGKLLHAAFEKM